MDMFSRTGIARKRGWICSLKCKIGKDIQPIRSSHVETVVLMSRVQE